MLVPGHPARADGSAHVLARLRVEAGAAVLAARDCGRLVLSGGAVANRWVEADVMAGVARELGVDPGKVALERAATNTWENVALSAPLLEGFDRVFVASDPLHAHRAVRYACEQRPERCASTFAFSRPSLLRGAGWVVPAALYELRARIRDELRHRERGRLPSVP